MKVYCLTNKINGKEYIGITARRVMQRFEEHCQADSYIGKAIRKNGKDNFTISIIDTAENLEELLEKEIYWINKKNTYSEGYNQTLGGEGVIINEHFVDIELDGKQKQFVEYVSKENKKPIDVGNDKEMAKSLLINIMKIYLEAERKIEKKKAANLINKLKPSYFETVMNTKIIDEYELKRWLT